MDLRIKKTRSSIINTFIELRSRKPLEKITVKELCEMAMINKSTFYSHYSDIYELSDSLETEVVTSIINSIGHPGYVLENPGAFTKELFLAYSSQETLIQTLFSGKQSGNLISKIEISLKEIIFKERPDYKDDLVKNVKLSFQIFGVYYAFEANRQFGAQKVISVLGQIAEETMNLL